MLQRGIELAPLVGDLGHAHVPDAGTGHRRPARRRGDLNQLLVGGERRIQASPGPLHPAEVKARPCLQGTLTGRAPSGDAGGEAALGVFEPTAHPLGYSQHPQAN